MPVTLLTVTTNWLLLPSTRNLLLTLIPMVLPCNTAGSDVIPRNGVLEVSAKTAFSVASGKPKSSLALAEAAEICTLEVSPVVPEEIWK